MGRYAYRLEPKAFPNTTFNYGGNGEVSPLERSRRITSMKNRWETVDIPRMDKIFPEEQWQRYRKLCHADQIVVQDATDPKDWMRRLINEHPPSPELSLVDILQEATKVQPMRVAYDTRLWKDVMASLRNIINEGHNLNWADNAITYQTLHPLETFEMLRINGNTPSGFGKWPVTLVDRLQQAGAAWVCVPAKDRIIPLYWKHYCDTHMIQYKEAISSPSPKKTLPSSSRTSKVTPAALPSKPPASLASRASPPDNDPVTQHLLQRKDEVNSELNVLNDPWRQKRGEFRGFGAKDNDANTLENLKENVALLVKTVDKKFKHDTSMLKNLCEATKLDTLLDQSFASKVETIVAELQGGLVTKEDLQGMVKSEEISRHVNAALGDHQGDSQTLFGEMHQVVCTVKDTIDQQNITINDLRDTIHEQTTTINDLNDKLNLQTIKFENIQAEVKAALEGLKPTSHDSQKPIIPQTDTHSRPPSSPYGSSQHLNVASLSHGASTSFYGESQDLLGPVSNISDSALPDNSAQGSGMLKHSLETSEPPVKRRRRLVSRRQYKSGDDSRTASKDDSSPPFFDSEKPSGDDQGSLTMTSKGLDSGSNARAGSFSKATFTSSSSTGDVSHTLEEQDEARLFLWEKSYERLLSEDSEDQASDTTIVTPEHKLHLLRDDDDSEILA